MSQNKKDQRDSSDSDESEDEDYKPDKNVEAPSEEDSDGEFIEEVSDGELIEEVAADNVKPKNRKRQTEKLAKPNETGVDADISLEDKERADALWADFLSDTNTIASKSNTNTPATKTIVDKTNEPERSVHPTVDKVTKTTVTETFEFAGEKINVVKEVTNDTKLVDKAALPKRNVLPTTNSLTKPGLPFGKRPATGGGLSSVLGQLGKKNKISTLEKTKLDWNSFKKNEGIDEELQTFNKGKDGYLERQDFLQRTDVRQFEIEKTLRQTKRSNR